MPLDLSGSIIIKLSKILAGMADAKDGKKDEKITGSIWNECIANNDSSMKMGENNNMTLSQASLILLKYLQNVTEDVFSNILSAFGIGSVDNQGNIITYDEYNRKHVDEYDYAGEMIKSSIYQDEQIKEIYEYNAGKIVKATVYNNNGTIEYIKESFNDSEGIHYKYTYYNGDGTVEYIKENFNDSEGTHYKYTYYNSDGTVDRILRTTKKGSAETFFNCDGTIKYTKYKTEDYKTGQCVETTYNSQGIKVCEEKNHASGSKEVTYFDEDYGTRRYTECYNAEGMVTRRTFYRPYEGTIRLEEEYTKDGYCLKKTRDPSGKVISSEKIDTVAALLPDGVVGSSAQIGQGDCYLMGPINSIRLVDGGQEYLDSLKKKVGDNYVITLPGAKIAANNLLENKKIDPDKMYITGTYTFTEYEVREILTKAGKRYSNDDGDTILLEAAFEKYRMEVYRTLLENDLEMESEAGLNTGDDSKNILSSGATYDAIFILTGSQSEVYYNKTITSYENFKYESGSAVHAANDKNEPLILAEDIDTTSSNGSFVKARYDSEIALEEILEKIKYDGDDGAREYIAVCKFCSDIGNHVFTIKEVTDRYVVLINPWYPDYTTTMDIDEYTAKVSEVTLAKMPMRA